jgi:hypothetical protein
VSVVARVVAHRAEDTAALKARLMERLYRTLTPLPSPLQPEGWRFGQALRASHVYDILLAEPGVSFVDKVRLRVDEVPGDVRALAADSFQPKTFYAGGNEELFRTGNDGDGWVSVGRFPGERVEAVETHPTRPGLVAVATRLARAYLHGLLRVLGGGHAHGGRGGGPHVDGARRRAGAAARHARGPLRNRPAARGHAAASPGGRA